MGPVALAILLAGAGLPVVLAGATNDQRETLSLPQAGAALVAGQFDNDGDVDLAVAGEDELLILWNNGRGYDRPTVVTGSPGTPLTFADLTFDGRPDLYGPGGLFVNTGATFTKAPAFPGGLTAGDIDGDRDLDYLTFGRQEDGNATVEIHVNNGGRYKAISLEVGARPTAVRLAQLDNIGPPEIIVLNGAAGRENRSAGGFVPGGSGGFFGSRLASNSITILVTLGGFLGGGLTRIDCRTGTDPVDLAIADVDNDTLPDVVTVNRGDDTVSVLYGLSLAGGLGPGLLTGCLLLEKPVHYKVGGDPQHVQLVDIDGDRDRDIVVLTEPYRKSRYSPVRPDATVSVLLNDGTGSFSSLREYAVGGPGLSLAVERVVGDRLPDVVVLNGPTVTTFENVEGRFASPPAPGLEGLPLLAIGIGAAGMLVAERVVQRRLDAETEDADET